MKSIFIPTKLEVIYKQRSSKRLPFYNEILILIDPYQIFTTAYTFNISQDGIGITSHLDIPVGTKILAHLVFDSLDCEAVGKIEWSSKNPIDNSFKMGVQLLKVTNEFNEIYQRINRKFNNPQTYTQSGTDYTHIGRYRRHKTDTQNGTEYIHIVPKAEQIYSLST